MNGRNNRKHSTLLLFFMAAILFVGLSIRTLCASLNLKTILFYRTLVKGEPGPGAWLAAIGIALLGCFCGCCLIPFGIESMKVFTHYCPNCNNLIGRYAGSSSLGSSYGHAPTVTTTRVYH